MNPILEDELNAISLLVDSFSYKIVDDKLVFKVTSSGSNKHKAFIEVSNLDEYPHSITNVTCLASQSIGNEQKNRIDAIINEVVSELTGFECLYDIYIAVQIFLNENYVDEESNVEELSDANETKYYRILNTINLPAESERVTEEEFIKWSSDFAQEMIQKGVWLDPTIDSTKLTGRKFFELAKQRT